MSGKADMSPRPSPLLLVLLLVVAEVGLEGAEGEMGDDSALSGWEEACGGVGSGGRVEGVVAIVLEIRLWAVCVRGWWMWWGV